MIGTNDRQQMLVDDVRETVRSEAWNKEYAARAGELAKRGRGAQGAAALGRHAAVQVVQDDARHAGLQRHLSRGRRQRRRRVRRHLGRLRRRERRLCADRPRHQRPAGPPARQRRHQPCPARQAQGRLLRRKAALQGARRGPVRQPARCHGPSGPRSAYRCSGRSDRPSNRSPPISTSRSIPTRLGSSTPRGRSRLRTPALDGGETLLGSDRRAAPGGKHPGRETVRRRHRARPAGRARRPVLGSAARLGGNRDAAVEHRQDDQQGRCALQACRSGRGPCVRSARCAPTC